MRLPAPAMAGSGDSEDAEGGDSVQWAPRLVEALRPRGRAKGLDALLGAQYGLLAQLPAERLPVPAEVDRVVQVALHRQPTAVGETAAQ